MSLTDSHAHLSASPLVEEIDAILARASAKGIKAIVNICTDETNLQKGLEIVKNYPWVFNAAGIHPHDAEPLGESFFAVVEQQARNKTLVAIGEIGLDYHYHHSSPAIQQAVLRKQFRLALQYNLPVLIHCREAYGDFFKILDEEYVVNGKHAAGVLHCFTGTMSEAMQGLERGFYISMSGVVTFKKSEELREVAKTVPLERLLIETDAPYLAPQSMRGKQNEPAYVAEVAEVIAVVKNIPLAEVLKATHDNLMRLIRNTTKTT
jgi:TatD DNase family protein